ncbi:MAG TPA: hypothetical protein VGC45_11755 [Gryllotalpicola sp.]
MVSTSPEDDAAYIALADLVEVLREHPGARVIGGHMVSLIAAAFPSEGLVERRTGDADAGIPIELAASGELHFALSGIGYEAENSNRYVKTGFDDPKPTIDLLIPTFTGKFGSQRRGDRVFNTMPGLAVALGPGIDITVYATLRDGRELVVPASVPGIEGAIIMKAYAWRDRRTQTNKDVIDLSNLLHVLEQHGPDVLGGWRLGTPGQSGSRGDTAKLLRQLADMLDAGRFMNARIHPRKVFLLIRKHIAK